ncbi:hypothetical protein ACJRO7_013216 [Eucalyptus globulus]|uniref:Receptor-like serine/threonine-protein kinase n=1 Tax=Eucalyptus globulus TaxID=34317 RepID=A0ABD3KX66_EUCGL
MVSPCGLCSLLLSFSFASVSQFFIFSDAQTKDYDYPTAMISTQWTNNATDNRSITYADGSIVQLILLRRIGEYGPAYACGFYCNGNCKSYLFAIFMVIFEGGTITTLYDGRPQVVWSANRNNPVKIGATLELTSKGNLMLIDANGTVAWYTEIFGKSVVGLNLTDFGNLVLFDRNNVTVWQSFDHPTDSLVFGQKLMAGQRLMPSVSRTDWAIDGMITLSMNNGSLSAQMETSPPQIYYNHDIPNPNASDKPPYVEFVNGSLAFFGINTVEMAVVLVPQASFAQYMKLGSDGHLRVYEWRRFGWVDVFDLLTEYLGDCGYPTTCGQYGICTNGQCSCPFLIDKTSYFKQVDDRQPNLGCSAYPLDCGLSQYHKLIELKDVMYFTFTANLENINASNCKEACANKCSCKAVIFEYGSEAIGDCYLLTQVFSLKKVDNKKISYNSIAYLKVQDELIFSSLSNLSDLDDESLSTSFDNQRSNHLRVIIASSLGALFAVTILIIIIVFFLRNRDDNEVEAGYLDQLPGMPTRYTYEDLKAITNDFSKKLGEGGFSSVFEGTLIDGTKVAVKHLVGFGQVKKSFLAEVEAVGSIHHLNLVRLMGFCADKSHMLLVYEYMLNGSLDRWIFHESNKSVLNWQQRRKIILHMAKGLNYLHEDCTQKIAHLDIKPQNILLDENFNAKVADFGLSKLINRDQSRVVTTMRGTPGYMAPEWLSAAITEKVNVYSFGIVILEIVCGRKIFDRSLDEEDMYLLSLFKRNAIEEQLLDIVDKCNEDMQLNGPQAVNMMRIAAWCLQGDYTRRPSMLMVIKVLEGITEVPGNLEYNFSTQPSTNGAAIFGQMHLEFSATTTLAPSVLSGPR